MQEQGVSGSLKKDMYRYEGKQVFELPGRKDLSVSDGTIKARIEVKDKAGGRQVQEQVVRESQRMSTWPRARTNRSRAYATIPTR